MALSSFSEFAPSNNNVISLLYGLSNNSLLSKSLVSICNSLVSLFVKYKLTIVFLYSVYSISGSGVYSVSIPTLKYIKIPIAIKSSKTTPIIIFFRIKSTSLYHNIP